MRAAPATLLGRDDELTAVQTLFDDGHRLVTVTGPGGVGKTSVADAVARRWAADGGQIWWVDAAAWDDPATLIGHIADQLGGGAGGPIERIAEHFGNGDGLLVVDNLEHLLGAGRDLAGLVNADERVRVLITSRIATRARGEHVVALAGLGAAATELLRQRMTAAGVGAAETNEALLERLCDLVDRLPLGIELAAARVPAFGLAGLVGLLGESSAALDDASRAVQPHHHSLLGTVRQSCALLDHERSMPILRRAAVLSAPFDVGLAAALAGVASATDVAAPLAELADTHLLNRHGEHYQLPVVVADYARTLLDDAERAATVDVLVEWALAASFRRDPRDGETTDAEHSAYMARLGPAYPAVRRCLELAAARGRDDVVRRLIGALRPYWIAAGLLHEGLAWAERAAHDRRENPPAYAELCFQAAALADYAVGAERSLRWTQRGIPAARASGQDYFEARLLETESAVRSSIGELDEAERAGVAAIAIYRRLGLDSFVASASSELANIYARRGDLVRADETYAATVAALAECGLDRVADAARIYWADVSRRRGDTTAALRHLELAERGLAGDPMLAEYVNAYRARVFNALGRYEHAAELAIAAATGAEEFGATTVRSVALGALAESLLRRGQTDEALAVLHQAADAAVAIDSTSAVEELIELVRGAASAEPAEPPTADRSDLHRWIDQSLTGDAALPPAGPNNPLSTREMDVLACVAQGLTDRQIGERLFISVRTVQSHVAHIFTKLTVNNRTSAIATATRLGYI